MNTLEKRQRGRPRRILSQTERDNLSNMVATNKADNIETDNTFSEEQHEDEQIRNIKKTLKDGEADSLNKWERNKKEKRLGEVKSYLEKNMVPKSHVQLRSQANGVQNYEFRKAVSFMAQKEMSKEFVEYAQEFKNLTRELFPDDIDKSNLESIRPETL